MLGKWYKLGHEDARNEQMRARLFCFTPSVCPLSLNGRVAQILSVVCTPRTVTCEYLKKEKHFFIAKAGPYSDIDDPEKELAERMEEIISQEHTKWIKESKKIKKDKTR